jgi:hypothetical protein
MDLVKFQARYGYAFVAKSTESDLLRAPIEPGLPVVNKLAQVVEIGSSRPALTLYG